MTAETDIQITRGRAALWLLYPAALLILAGCFAYGATIYDSLPDTVPTHWGGSGQPDAWAEKSFGSVFLPLLIGAGLILFLALIAAAVPLMVPAEQRATVWERYRREGMIRGTIAAMGGVGVLLACILGYLTVNGWRNPEQVALWPALTGTGLLLAAVVAAYALASRWARRTALARGTHPTEEEQAEDRLWVAGGFYNNPDDPHVLVPKRSGSGTGMTVNVGNAKGRAAVVVFLAVFVGIPLVLGVVLAL